MGSSKAFERLRDRLGDIALWTVVWAMMTSCIWSPLVYIFVYRRDERALDRAMLAVHSSLRPDKAQLLSAIQFGIRKENGQRTPDPWLRSGEYDSASIITPATIAADYAADAIRKHKSPVLSEATVARNNRKVEFTITHRQHDDGDPLRSLTFALEVDETRIDQWADPQPEEKAPKAIIYKGKAMLVWEGTYHRRLQLLNPDLSARIPVTARSITLVINDHRGEERLTWDLDQLILK